MYLSITLRPSLLALLCLGMANLCTAAPTAGTGSGGSIRQPAEFEPLRGVMVTYPLLVPVSLVAEIAESDELVTMVQDAAAELTARAQYLQAGVNLANCSFIIQANESHWTRDYGPWFSFDSTGQARINDFVYEWANSPGDDGTPSSYAQSIGMPVAFMDLKTAGGNYMTDGQGTSMACDNVLTINNPNKTLPQIEAMLAQNLGLERNHFLDDPGPYWWHVDCYAKFLDQDTIMVAQLPPGHSAHQQLEDTVAYLEKQISCWGTPYEVVRVVDPPGLYYSNSLILNGKVLVPIQGNLAADVAALNAYRAAMPGYEVIGFPSLPGAWPEKWVSHDALHCRTKELQDMEMLYISHQPLLDRPSQTGGFRIEAEVIAHSGTALTSAPELRWRSTGNWNSLPMSALQNNKYEAWIPVQPTGTQIKYYIHAEDGSGRKENHPYIGRRGAHEFSVTTLGTDVSAISLKNVGKVEFRLDAGPQNANRAYFLLGSDTGAAPGIQLPGGLILPINRGPLANYIRGNSNSSAFQGFSGTLDSNGRAVAVMDLSGLTPWSPGLSLDFAFTCMSPFDFVSNSIQVHVLE